MRNRRGGLPVLLDSDVLIESVHCKTKVVSSFTELESSFLKFIGICVPWKHENSLEPFVFLSN